jgi:prevent-host-death family protein
MATWALQDAKNRLSELVRQALGEGAQEITIRGEPAVTVIATRELQRLRAQPHNLADFLGDSPLRGLESPARDKDSGRVVDFGKRGTRGATR